VAQLFVRVLVALSLRGPLFPSPLLFLLWLLNRRHRLASGVTRAVRRCRLAARLGFASGKTIPACMVLKRQRGGAACEMI